MERYFGFYFNQFPSLFLKINLNKAVFLTFLRHLEPNFLFIISHLTPTHCQAPWQRILWSRSHMRARQKVGNHLVDRGKNLSS